MSQISFDNTENAFQYKSTESLKKAQLLFSTLNYPTTTSLGMMIAKFIAKHNLPGRSILKNTIYSQFCGGETLEEIAVTTAVLEKYGVDVCLDYGVEGAAGEENFDKAVHAFLETIRFAAERKNIPFIPIKITGFAESSLLDKISNQATLNQEEHEAWERVVRRVDTICAEAAKYQLMILVDAEESWLQQAVDDLTNDLMEQYNKATVVVFNTYQLYRHDRLAYIKQSLELAKSKGYKLGVKIVRGAYMEKERERAKQMGYLSPIQPDKEATDRDYNAAIDFCFEHLNDIVLFIGTHNEASCLKAVEKMKALGLKNDDTKVSFSQLYGMSDNITFNLAAQSFNASKYLPYGPLKDVIPYLMRRANENTSVAGQTGRELFLINKELERRKSK